MKLSKIIKSGAIAGTFCMSLFIEANAQTSDQANIPATTEPQSIEAMDHMKMHQQHMQQIQAGNMPMMEGCNHMMKDPAMQDNMSQMRQQRMWQGAGPQEKMSKMNPEMRQYMQMRQKKMKNMRQRSMRLEMMRMRQQHMQTMEQRLTNIEKLLSELVELQKKQ